MYRVPSGHGDTLSRRRAASPLVMLVEVEERWETPDHPWVSSRNWGGTEENRTINCFVGLDLMLSIRRHK
ncbi:hypothetical protein TNCV_4041521 [Trichonephila clavipes]|nr:hypothetical protein TNCV_4041521 [Trichonephila clavipes]